MVQERVSGNGNFDIDAIRAAANAMEGGYAATPQEAVDPQTAQLEAETEEFEIDLQNPSSNRIDEAERMLDRPDVARLKPGVLGAIRSNIAIAEERREQSGEIMRAAEVWEQNKERQNNEQKERARTADIIDDAMSNQFSTTPDRYGMSQRDYNDLNEELKTRDGQERMMAFLRMLHPEMSDAQIRARMNDMQAVAAVEAGTATRDQRARVDSMSPSDVADLKTESRQFIDGRDQNLGYDNTRQFDTTTAVIARNGDTGISVTGSLDWLEAGSPSTVTSTAPLTVAGAVSGGDQPFASAPSLRANFGQAQAATAPLDVPAAPQLAAIAPAVPPPQVASTGFEV